MGYVFDPHILHQIATDAIAKNTSLQKLVASLVTALKARYMVGRMLYCADFLDPGRTFDQETRASLAGRLPREVDGVLRDVLQARLNHMVRSRWPLPEPTVRFWNSLFRIDESG